MTFSELKDIAMRTFFSFPGVFAVGVAAMCWLPRSAAEESPPLNVIVILADDLGWADLGCYGADVHQTPNIDRFASQGVRFTQAYASAPVCSPTRAALLTGKYPARLHMTVWFEQSRNPPRNHKLIPPVTVGNLPHAEVTIAERLSDAGYFTAHIGKWHLGAASHYPQTQGFDVNIGGTFWGAPSTFFYPYRGRWSNSEELRYVPHLEWGQTGEYLTDRLTDEALATIDRVADRPFFLHLAYHTVHTPIEGKPDVVNRFTKEIRPEHHHQNAGYAAMVHSLDENVGRILQKLKALEIDEHTLVIFTSDNGGFVNVHRGQQVTNNHPLRSGKGSLYEGGIRVPLIVRLPGTTPTGAVCEEMVLSMDLHPTIAAMADCPVADRDEDLDGLDVSRILKDPAARLSRDTVFFHYPHYYPTTTPVSAVRSGPWKLLEYHEDGRAELYHLGDDPGETNDVAAQRADQVKLLRKKLAKWRDDVDAQMPRPNPNYGAKRS